MSIILLVFLSLSLIKIKYINFNKEFISHETTTMINGFFVILIFMAHFVQYSSLGGILDDPYLYIYRKMDQLIVVTFLFFSGYGIMESYCKKGYSYLIKLPYKRFFKLFFRFFIAVLCFLILNTLMGQQYPIKTILLSFIGWESIGNSNWYIFVVMCLYIIFYFSFLISKGNKKIGILNLLILSLLLIVALKLSGKDPFWYNTIFCFGAGVIFSLARPMVISLYANNNLLWIFSFFFSLVLFIFFFKARNHLIFYQVHALLFVCIILLISMKIKLNSIFLKYIGKFVFSVYIFQRIPMIIFQDTILSQNMYVYFIVSFVCTILISIIFEALMKRINM